MPKGLLLKRQTNRAALKACRVEIARLTNHLLIQKCPRLARRYLCAYRRLACLTRQRILSGIQMSDFIH